MVMSGVYYVPELMIMKILADKHNWSSIIDIQMDIKPRATSGHLFSIHGKQDYLVLEMSEGSIRFIVRTANGIMQTTFEPPKQNSLCDGKWHKIRGKSSVFITMIIFKY